MTERISAKEYLELQKQEKKPKYKNTKIEVDGISFDSELEAKRYEQLKLMQRAGEITDLQLQHRFVLLGGYVNGAGDYIRPITYVCDFKYRDRSGRLVIEDTKGMKTDVYRIKKKLFEEKYAPMIIREITKEDV